VVDTAVGELDTGGDEGHKVSVDRSEAVAAVEIVVCYGVEVVVGLVGNTTFVDHIVVSPVSFCPSFLHREFVAEKLEVVNIPLEEKCVVVELASVAAYETSGRGVLLEGCYKTAAVVAVLAFVVVGIVVVEIAAVVEIVVVEIVVVEIVVVDVEGHCVSYQVC
jgi:hypothetical protein